MEQDADPLGEGAGPRVAQVDAGDELEGLAADYVEKNYDASGDISVDLTITGQKVTLDASFQFPTLFKR